jgi:hypothetical protein
MADLAESVQLSASAISLFRLHVERLGDVDVNDSTREAYRELAGHGLMMAGSTFRDGPESVYVLTREGFERKAELLACAEENACASTSPSRAESA